LAGFILGNKHIAWSDKRYKLYIGKLVDNSKLNKSKWQELEKKTTWFSANKALEWGLVDRIE
jgi:ATP-dependent protease ClpP protease subunit